MNYKKLYLLLIAIAVCSCGGGSSSGNSSYEDTSMDYEFDGADSRENQNDDEQGMPQQMYLCPMCQGNRQIQHFYSGELIDCPACLGAGKVSAETIQQLQDAAQTGEYLANEVINGGGNEAISDDSGGRSRDAIEMEIERCEHEKASIEEQLEYVESVTNRSYLSSQLTELNCRIRQLQRELQYAN